MNGLTANLSLRNALRRWGDDNGSNYSPSPRHWAMHTNNIVGDGSHLNAGTTPIDYYSNVKQIKEGNPRISRGNNQNLDSQEGGDIDIDEWLI